ncbi:hypothetical protein [Synechococcus phage S-B68]|nr:hypothetical protein [Synechococcus phage S-B68]
MNNSFFFNPGATDTAIAGNSLRWRNAQRLYHDPSSTGSNTTWTLSLWFKRGDIDTGDYNPHICCAGDSASSLPRIDFAFLNPAATAAGDALSLAYNPDNAGWHYLVTERLFRDPAAWYHIVIVADTSNATAADRLRLYVNGERNTTWGSTDYPNQNDNLVFCSGAYRGIGTYDIPASTPTYTDGYFAEIHCLDGTAVTDATDFGQYNAAGVWVPKTVSGVTYGTTGFYLDFSNSDNIGEDFSGNNNDFTSSGFELGDITSEDYDWMLDHPKKNYTVGNEPSERDNDVYSDGNLSLNLNNTRTSSGTIQVSSGKHYWEWEMTTLGTGIVGIADASNMRWDGQDEDFTNSTYQGYGIDDGGNWYHNGSFGSFGANWYDMGVGVILGFTLDLDLGQLSVSVNGVDQGIMFSNIDTTKSWVPAVRGNPSSLLQGAWNFGQRPFAYPPGEVSSTTAFKTVLYTGNASNNVITGVGFAPDLLWLKDRSAARQHNIFDSVRGGIGRLRPSDTDAEHTAPDGFVSLDSDGFTLDGAASGGDSNVNGGQYVAWCFNAGTGSAASNTDGTITSTVKASPENGFSVVTYTGSSSNFTFGHGLNAEPSFIAIKNRSASANWFVLTKATGSWTYGHLNLGDALTSAVQTADSTIVDLKNAAFNWFNAAGDNFVAYCFADAGGKVKTGSYTGNGSTSGPYVDLGFKPAMVLIKGTSASRGWYMYDTTRSPSNPADNYIQAHVSDAESTSLGIDIDLLNTGFSLKSSSGYVNGSSETYIYIAFAENFTEGTQKPTTKFNTLTYTGDGTNTRSFTGLGFNPDLVWIKQRTNAGFHVLGDSVRGSNGTNGLNLNTNSTGFEGDENSGYVKTWDADGFSIEGSSGATYPIANVNNSGESYIAWCWNAGTGSAASNTDGTITSTVKADSSAGFSIVTYTGNVTAGATVGHGLSSTPSMVIIKCRNGSRDWTVYHKSVGGTGCLELNSANAANTDYAFFNDTDPTDTVFTLGNDAQVNASGDTYVAYCFADTDGAVKTGSYVGTGNTTQVPMIECGFRPAFVMVKSSSSGATAWEIIDNKRGGKGRLFAESSAAESTADSIQFTDTGFHPLSTDGNINSSGFTYIYIAFAQEFDPDTIAREISTEYLPAVDITNPSEHFTTILDTGANILTSAQATFPNGLWWIKDRANSNQHQLVDSTRGGNAITCPQIALPLPYVAPAGNSVAWCWSAPTSYTNPTSSTTGRINVDAGFAILNASISAGTFTVPHGLSAAPEFLIAVGSSNSATQRNVWHKSIAASEALYLNGTGAKVSAPNLWASTAPTSTEITLGSDWASSGATTVGIYAWHSVPGYSAIGSYVGNGSTDGPFIQTGFRPGWIMVKQTSPSVGSWQIWDTQVNQYNPTNGRFNADRDLAEQGSLPIDIVSNGFKVRHTDGSTNESGYNFIYAAFAEHPMGGSNVSPAPAR